MSRYMVWTTPYEGEYVKADKVEKDNNIISFLKEDGTVVKTFLENEIDRYSEVEWLV